MVRPLGRANGSFSNKQYSGVAVLLFLACLIRPASAGFILDEPITGGRLLVVEDGYVTAEFLGSDAGYFNTLYLDRPGNGDLWVFDKNTSRDQNPVNLGYYTAGTELVFRLDVTNTGLSFFTGDSDRNPDGLAHARATTTSSELGIYFTTVGFEDLLNGGDLDFNDFLFQVSNIVDPPGDLPAVPVPPVAALLGIGLLGLSYFYRRKAA